MSFECLKVSVSLVELRGMIRGQWLEKIIDCFNNKQELRFWSVRITGGGWKRFFAHIFMLSLHNIIFYIQ